MVSETKIDIKLEIVDRGAIIINEGDITIIIEIKLVKKRIIIKKESNNYVAKKILRRTLTKLHEPITKQYREYIFISARQK